MRLDRSTLLAGAFGAFLLVIAGSAFAVWRNATTAQSRISELHTAHMRAGGALASIRTTVYLTGILTRDYLLDPDPSHAQQYVEQFERILASTEDSFRVLDHAGLDAGQSTAVRHLREELRMYLRPTEIALDWSPLEKSAHRTSLLRQRVGRRQEIFALTGQVERLIGDNFQRERERLTGADRDFRVSLTWITGATLLLGAAIAGLTIARMRSLERQSELAETELRRLSGQIRTAQEQERKYLSRELHDQVGQLLTGLRMELTSMARIHGDAESEFSSRIARAKGTVEQTLKIVRNIAMLLRPSMLDDLGLTPALAWLVKEMSRSSGIAIRAEVDPSLDSLPEANRTCIYRVVQEALTNSVRHSGAKNVDVVFASYRGWVTGSISDDGRGFDTDADEPKGLGLLGMEERVRELEGRIRVVSSPGQGTRVEVRLPNPAGLKESDDQNSHSGRSWHRANGIEAAAGTGPGHGSSG